MPVFRCPLVRAGFGVQEECHQRIWPDGRSRLLGVIFPFRNAKILRSSSPREPVSGPLRVRFERKHKRLAATVLPKGYGSQLGTQPMNWKR